MDARELLLALAAAATAGDLDEVARLARHDRVTESFRRMMTAFPDVCVEPQWTVLEGRRAAAFASIKGTQHGAWRGLPPTGRPVDVCGMLAIEVNETGDGVADIWIANDWLGIAQQLGVPLALPS